MTTIEQTYTPELPASPPAWFNKMMAWMLRSPLHSLVSKDIMLLTLTGRKSGREYIIPVTYVRQGNSVTCSTEKAERMWWRNLRGGAEVTMRLQGKDYAGQANVIADDAPAQCQYPACENEAVR